MEFYLHYDGPLKANGNIKDKQHLNVATGRLLRENAGQNEVVLLIKITTKAVKAIWANLGLG